MHEDNPSRPPVDADFLAQMDSAYTGWRDPVKRLRDALANNELQLYIQPIAKLGEDRPVMAEVLVRLREEEKKLLPPGDFLTVFEQYGMMPDLDRWVVTQMVQRIARHSPGGFRQFSINVAGKTLLDERFPEYVSRVLRQFGVPAQALCFEVDEIVVQRTCAQPRLQGGDRRIWAAVSLLCAVKTPPDRVPEGGRVDHAQYP
jgi:sensor c-di-GMP phosphodiesterase-like protein